VIVEPFEPGHEALAAGLAAELDEEATELEEKATELEEEPAVTIVVLTTVVVATAEEEELAEDVDATGDEDTGTDAILAPQTLLLELGAPRPFFK
jgi:enoyl-CoA hydratase/carnithine racemase